MVTAGEVDAGSVSRSADTGCRPFGHRARCTSPTTSVCPSLPVPSLSDSSAHVPAPQDLRRLLSNEVHLVVFPGVVSSKAFHSRFASSQMLNSVKAVWCHVLPGSYLLNPHHGPDPSTGWWEPG